MNFFFSEREDIVPVLGYSEAQRSEESASIIEFISELSAAGAHISCVDTGLLGQCIRLGCITLLRCTQVLLVSLGVTLDPQYNLGTFEHLVASIGLPSVQTMLQMAISNTEIRLIMRSWVHHYLHMPMNRKMIVHLSPPSLVALPASFSTLALQSSRYICQRSQTPPLAPAKCLICGVVVCARSTCCQLTREVPGLGEHSLGSCFLHAKRF